VFDAATGARRWSKRLITAAGGGAERARYLAAANGVVVIASHNGILFAYDELNGNLLWTSNAQLLAQPYSPTSTGVLAIIGNSVTAVDFTRALSIYDLRTGTSMGMLGGTLNRFADVQSLRGSQMFVQSGFSLSIVDLVTGIKHWEVLTPRFTYRREFVVLAGDTLFDAYSEFGLRSFKLPP
jgi:hypothetical protein